MPTSSDEARLSGPVGWRSVALPTEHGGWGFTLEPVILGLLVAPSVAAVGIAAAAVAIFLARRPARLVATDLVRRRWLPRTSVAAGFSLFYGLVAVAGGAGALVTAAAPFWQPIAMAVPLAGFALYADANRKSRTLFAEIAGSVAMGATAPAIALADGWEWLPAFGLWLVLVARDITTIALVRGQIRRVRGKPIRAGVILLVQAATLPVMVAAAAFSAVPWMSVVAIAAIGLLAYVSLRRPPVPAKVVGWTQIGVGLGVVGLTAIGVSLGW